MGQIIKKRSDYISWDEYFMGVATLASFRSKDPNSQVGACIVDALYSLLREENLFTHRIHRPSVRFFVTEESLEGGLQKVPLSAQYVQSEYVPHIN